MHWKDFPNADDARFVLPLIRARAGQPLLVVHLSEKWAGLRVHWTGKQNVPCIGEDVCVHCGKSIGTWQGFMVVRRPHDAKRALLQITPNVVPALLGYQNKHKTLAGLTGVYTRAGKRDNSPLVFTYHSSTPVEAPINIEETRHHVARIFRMKLESQ